MKILDTKISSAKDNMLLDQKLLDHLSKDDLPILHLYQWEKPSLTYGHFIRPEDYLNLDRATYHNLELAKRPTGGGIVFHIWDLAFSFLMPASHPAFSINTLENYAFVNEVVLKTVKSFFNLELSITKKDAESLVPECQNFCMAKPTQYDVVYSGMKIAGAAQRRKRQGYLHQGTISLIRPNFTMLEEILLSKDVLKAMISYTFTPLIEAKRLHEVRIDLQNLLADNFNEALKLAPYF